jgi:hypothetical protein
VGAEHGTEFSSAPAEGASCGGECCGHGVWFFDGEYLLMRPRRRDLDFAITDPNTAGTAVGAIKSLEWDVSSGFRVGGGWAMEPEGLSVGVFYTYLHAHDDQGLVAPTGGVLYSTLSHPGFIDAVNTAFGNTSLNYHVVDLEVGSNIQVGKCVHLWVGTGGKFASIDQSLDAFYDGLTASSAQVSSPIDFDGGGVRVGVDGSWTVGRGFSLFSRAFGSLMIGDFRTNLLETNGAGAFVITDVTEHYWKVVPVLELAVGAGWENNWLRVRAGYELTNWFGLVDSPDIVHDFSNKLSHRTSDLSLDGLMVSLQVMY